MHLNCRICDNKISNKIHIAKEMMYGYRDKFEYLECNKCGCLQLARIPNNISKYYSSDYYSFKNNNQNKFIKFLKKKRGLNALGIRVSFTGNIISKLVSVPEYTYWLKGNVKLNSKILDVGCGNGNMLRELKNIGFKDLYGVDPYIEKSHSEKGLKIIKGNIFDIKNKFDLIMFNHSFEHLTEQYSILKEVKCNLNENGKLIIRIPISSFAWKKYNVNWASLDAPRHIYLHTLESFRILAEKCKFKIIATKFDSSDFQFWASEQYKCDIPLLSKRSYRINPKLSIFTQSDLRQFKIDAEKLNDNYEGDQAGFILTHSESM